MGRFEGLVSVLSDQTVLANSPLLIQRLAGQSVNELSAFLRSVSVKNWEMFGLQNYRQVITSTLGNPPDVQAVVITPSGAFEFDEGRRTYVEQNNGTLRDEIVEFQAINIQGISSRIAFVGVQKAGNLQIVPNILVEVKISDRWMVLQQLIPLNIRVSGEIQIRARFNYENIADIESFEGILLVYELQ